MISEAEPFLINGDAWMMLGPVLALVLTVLSLNLFGDALRDKLDPRSADRGVRAQHSPLSSPGDNGLLRGQQRQDDQVKASWTGSRAGCSGGGADGRPKSARMAATVARRRST